jgi:hypothetical protein
MYDLSGAKGWRKRPQISAEAKGIQSAIKTDIFGLQPKLIRHQ